MVKPEQKQRLIIIGVVAFIILAAGYLLWPKNNVANEVEQAGTSLKPSDWQPLDAIISLLPNKGMTVDQASLAKFAFVQYAKDLNIDVTKITAKPASISHSPRTKSEMEEGIFNYVFDTKFNNTIQKARFEYSGYYDGELLVYNGAGKQLYDSGPLNSKNPPTYKG